MKVIYKCQLCAKTVTGDLNKPIGENMGRAEVLDAIMARDEYYGDGVPLFMPHQCGGGVTAVASLVAVSD